MLATVANPPAPTTHRAARSMRARRRLPLVAASGGGPVESSTAMASYWSLETSSAATLAGTGR